MISSLLRMTPCCSQLRDLRQLPGRSRIFEHIIQVSLQDHVDIGITFSTFFLQTFPLVCGRCQSSRLPLRIYTNMHTSDLPHCLPHLTAHLSGHTKQFMSKVARSAKSFEPRMKSNIYLYAFGLSCCIGDLFHGLPLFLPTRVNLRLLSLRSVEIKCKHQNTRPQKTTCPASSQ